MYEKFIIIKIIETNKKFNNFFFIVTTFQTCGNIIKSIRVVFWKFVLGKTKVRNKEEEKKNVSTKLSKYQQAFDNSINTKGRQ